MTKFKILYIEDYPVVQAMYLEVLQKHFDVDTATDGREALEKIKTARYDAILLDLLLPQVTGIEFLREYKASNYAQDNQTRIIVLSDFDSPETQETVHDLGVEDYWIKVENTPHALADRIQKLLDGSVSGTKN